MALPVEKLGRTYGGTTEVIDAGRVAAYADATNDPNPAYRDGTCAPPVFGVVPTWEVMTAAVADVVPPEAMPMIVHGEQDMHLHRPLVPGRSLTTTAEPHSVRVGRSGTRLTTRVASVDADSGDPVLDQYVTMFVRGMADGESAGPDKPGHGFPETARRQPAGEYTVHVDADQTFRYRDASGDHNPIHVDEAVATAVGLPGIIVHGLCTMAMCGQAVVETAAAGDPTRLRRLAVRFSRPVRPGQDVVTALYHAGEGAGRRDYAFEATSGGDLVITNGWAEVAR